MGSVLPPLSGDELFYSVLPWTGKDGQITSQQRHRPQPTALQGLQGGEGIKQPAPGPPRGGGLGELLPQVSAEAVENTPQCSPDASAQGVRALTRTEITTWWLSGKESTWRCRRRGFDPWVRKIPRRRK